MNKKSKPKRGRPRKYSDVELFQKKIDEYFQRCEEKGIIPVVTELALAIGLSGRQALLNYEGRDEYVDAIKKAKARIEAALQRRLLEPYPTGAIFDLKNNFSWRDVTDVRAVDEEGKGLEMGSLEVAARLATIFELARKRKEEDAQKLLPEKVNDETK